MRTNAPAPSPKSRGRPPKVTPNPHRHHLQDCFGGFFKLRYQLPRKVARDLDDIISGVTKLDLGGNARPVSRGLILRMLRDLPEISTQSVQTFTGRSLSHSKKLATLMRITASAYENVVTEDGAFSSDGDLPEDDLSRFDFAWEDRPDCTQAWVGNKAHLL